MDQFLHSFGLWTQDENKQIISHRFSVCEHFAFWPFSCLYPGQHLLGLIFAAGFLLAGPLQSFEEVCMMYEFEQYSITKKSTGTLCSCISWRSNSLYFVLTIDCLVQCKTSSHRLERGATGKLILSLYFCVHCPHIISYLLSLSVNHYVENVPIIMLVRFKPTEEGEKLCTVKKNVLLQTKAPSVWQIKKNISVKRTRSLCLLLMFHHLFCLFFHHQISCYRTYSAHLPHSQPMESPPPHLSVRVMSWELDLQ